jgi:tRNA A37 threonylcarbamoyladenosine dehydratase
MRERIHDINPEANVKCINKFVLPENIDEFDFTVYDYIVDAIDTMDSKVGLIVRANNLGVKIISALSAGNKLNPYMFEAADIYSTSVCPIAKILRKRLREENVLSHKVVYSKEPSKKIRDAEIFDGGKTNVGSISYVPSVMGLLLAGEVIADIIERE